MGMSKFCQFFYNKDIQANNICFIFAMFLL
ncbi:MAG: hypothetical protein RL757_108 [Bacteroidota bacterium]|jgi:hypothetical protein